MRSHPEQVAGGNVHLVQVGDATLQQLLGFRDIGGKDCRAWQQSVAQRRDGAVFQQFRATGGDHDRIQHHRAACGGNQVVLQRIGHHADHLRIRQHAQFDGADLEVVEARIDLRFQEVRWRHMHGADAAGVLRGQCSDRGQSMHTVRGEGLQVGLDAGTATGVGAGDGQGGNNLIFGHGGIVQWRGMWRLALSIDVVLRSKGRAWHRSIAGTTHSRCPWRRSGWPGPAKRRISGD